jgi:hypothetical protein
MAPSLGEVLRPPVWPELAAASGPGALWSSLLVLLFGAGAVFLQPLVIYEQAGPLGAFAGSLVRVVRGLPSVLGALLLGLLLHAPVHLLRAWYSAPGGPAEGLALPALGELASGTALAGAGIFLAHRLALACTTLTLAALCLSRRPSS